MGLLIFLGGSTVLSIESSERGAVKSPTERLVGLGEVEVAQEGEQESKLNATTSEYVL